jgi:glycosyltransferase involved in cell wall biosynthesis
VRIALLVPPFLPCPPPGYGGIERVVATLAEGLAARGHAVTLFAHPDSLTVRNTDSPTHRLTDSPTHRLTDSPTHRLTDSPTHALS